MADDPRTWLLELRNGVVVVSPAPPASAVDATVSRRELAEFVLGLRALGPGNAAISDFSAVLDRSLFRASAELGDVLDDPHEQERVDAYGEH